MNLSGLFIARPVMTTLVMLALLMAGVVGYQQLPVSDLPNVDFPTLVVTANLPGASPETMASSVATPLERQFSTIAGITSMNSSSVLGNTQITLQFELDRDIDAAAQDVQTAISQTQRDLPREMSTPPSYRKVNPADQPVIYLALSSPVLPLSEVDEYAQTFIAQRISMLNGVAQVNVFGSQKYAVRVQVDPRELASRQIGIDEVVDAVQKGNSNLPTGILQGTHKAFTVESNGPLFKADDFAPLVVTWRDGAPVRIQDLGQAIDSVENNRAASWYGDTRAVVLAIQRQPGTNTIAVVDTIKALLPQFREQMPASVDLNILSDRSISIRASVNDVKFTLILTVFLVIFTIFLFLRNLVATIIPAIALILSVVGTFAGMRLLGFSLDNLSLMALTLSVGFVVDDAIVMVENIIRHMEKGEAPRVASVRGAGEIGFTIVSMTVSLVAVFIPVLFLGGIVGRLLNEFAITISVALLISGFISLTQTPMLCSLFLKPYEHDQHGRLYNTLEAAFNGMLHAYDTTLKLALRGRALTLLVLIPLIALSAYLFSNVPKGFLPAEDNGQIFGITEAAQGISFEDLVRHQREIAAIIQKSPEKVNFMSAVGGGGSSQSGGNNGRVFINLKPRAERRGIDAIIQDLRQQLAVVPGIKVFMQNRPSINLSGTLTKSQYQFTLTSMDTSVLYENAPKLEERLKQIPGLLDVASDLLITNPEVDVEIDRDKAAALGISAQQIEDALYGAYGTRQVSTIYAPNNQYRVIVELLPEYQSTPDAMNLLYVRSGNGELIPLSTIASLKPGMGLLSVAHLGQFPAVTLSFNLAPGTALGAAVEQVQRAAREILPPTVNTAFQGTAQAFQSSMGGLGILLLAAVLVIYIVLGILYESFMHPITILSGLPAAGVGALATLLYFKMELNLFSIVGIIMLIGIVKKNAIMMIDFALEAQRQDGLSPEKAIYQACLVRFRPIMMTTMAALMGTVPIAIGHGAGAESRQPLGMAVLGGLLFSQLLTLYITPVVYIYLEQAKAFFSRQKPSATPTAEAAV